MRSAAVSPKEKAWGADVRRRRLMNVKYEEANHLVKACRR